jgi:Alr-MurF fusion protein
MEVKGYPADVLAEICGGTLHGGDSHEKILHLAIDSRREYFSGGTLFIALKGPRHDGHAYLKDLHARGVGHFMVSDVSALPEGTTAIVVRDTLDALQRLAGWHRARFRYPVIGITGSNGKTIVKEWLYQMLHTRDRVVRSPGSWNSQVGVPLSVWSMSGEHDIAIFEAGISQTGEMERLRSVIRPDIGVFTNIGPAHEGGFRNEQQKALEKIRLFEGAEALVFCADHHAVTEALRLSGLQQRLKLRGWSRENDGWLHVVREDVLERSARISVLNDHVEMTFEIPFTDKASIENAIHCVTLLLHMGHDPKWIATATMHLTPVAMRLEVIEGIHGIKLINDAYSNDPASLGIALDHLRITGAGTRRVVVLSEMHGSGTGGMTAGLNDILLRNGVDHVLAIGEGLAGLASSERMRVEHFADAASMLATVEPERFAGATVLVKGARAFALEQVVRRWERRVHGTVLEIDLEAVRHNLNHHRTHLARGTRIMAMVKAFGYGSGALELARLFAHEQVHYLGVAYADEGVELRRNGIRLPILVMNPEPVPFRVMQENRLEAEVYDERSIAEASAYMRDNPASIPVHIELDTGMHRLGFTQAGLPELLEVLRSSPWLKVASIFSHLVAAEDKEHDDFTREQIRLFHEMSMAIISVLGYRPMLHIANSAAALRFPVAQMDMVRLGIGLHGIGADREETARLLPATSLRSPVAQIKQVPKGATIGYGRAFKVEKDMTVAVIPIGYADGFSRRLGNGRGRVWVHGRACPVVGNVCMDMCMIDVTGLEVKVGDDAWIFNAEHPVTELAQAMETIPYEVLTSISQRVKRVHVHS